MQIEPSEKEHMLMKVWCLKSFIYMDSSDALCIWWAREIITRLLINFLSLQLNEFLQSEMKQKLSSVENIICITAIADKKIKSVFCISGVLGSPPHSAVQFKQLLQLGSIFSWNPQRKRKKANQLLYVN